MQERSKWAVVLAAGDGTRLSRLTTRDTVSVPKQFCLLDGGTSLLELALARAERVLPRSNVVPIVAAAHREFWARDLAGLSPANVVVQPSNRGTAAGVLLPLLAILERDPEASVVLIPSDHYVEREDVLAEKIEASFGAVEQQPDAIVLVGVEAEAPESGYGWIVPATGPEGSLRRVQAFVEKPAPALAIELLGCGAVWNTFVIVARARALIDLYHRRLPGLLWGMRAARGAERLFPGAVRAYYAELTSTDFSRNLLQGAEDGLWVMTVPACGWNDLGTPERVAACVGRLPQRRRVPQSHVDSGRVDLVRAVAAGI